MERSTRRRVSITAWPRPRRAHRLAVLVGIVGLATAACDEDKDREPVLCHFSGAGALFLCATGGVDANGDPVGLEKRVHYLVNGATAALESPKVARKQVFEVENALGTALFRTEAPLRTLEPVSVGVGHDPLSPPESAKPLDCYAASDRGIPGHSVFEPAVHEAVDAVTGQRESYSVVRPAALCVPRGGPIDDGDALACYQADSRSPTSLSVDVVVADGSSAFSLTVRVVFDLCLRSELRPDGPRVARAGFPFQLAGDPVAVAMQTLWRQQFEAPQTREAASAAW